MKFNATYQYRNASTDYEFVDGGACYIEQTTAEQLRETDWGSEIVLGYKMYVKEESRFNVGLGDTVYITMQDGQQFICTVVGNDFTVHKIYTFTISNSNGTVMPNGSVAFIEKSGGGIDPTTGYPIAATVSWRTALDCRFVKTTENLQAKTQSEPIVQVNYTIYIAGDAVPSEQLKLYNSNGDLLGEFSVIGTEYIDTKGVTKITV